MFAKAVQSYIHMNRDKALLHQPHPIQPKPPSSFKALIWKVIFVLLLIVNLIIGCWVFWIIDGVFRDTSGYQVMLPLLLIPIPLFVIFIIDFIAVLSYKRRHHPQEIVRVIGDTVVIVITIFAGIALIFLALLWYSPG